MRPGTAIRLFAAALLGAAGAASAAGPGAPRMLDDFERIDGWSTYAADGVDVELSQDEGVSGRSLRVDFNFRKGGGYAVFRRAFDIDLPENYAFTFALRGDAPPNDLEFKLIDSSGENVWWKVRRDVRFSPDWETFRIKRRHIEFAWGPVGGGEIDHAAAVEFAVTAGSGGAGTIWIDDLRLQELPPPGAEPPPVAYAASSSTPGHQPRMAGDGDSTTAWMSEPSDRRPWIELDLGGMREFGGLTVDWGPELSGVDYGIAISGDGATWKTIRNVVGGIGGRDRIYLPETESAYLRLNVARAARGGTDHGLSLREITIEPLEWSETRAAFFEAVARDYPRGTFPRAMSGEASYWTVVGVDRDREECLLSEDGMLETGKGGFSVEPFLWDGRLVGWGDVRAEQSLRQGCLPIPSVHWAAGDLELEVTAFGTGPPDSSSVVARYRVANTTAIPREATLFLAIRPFQVNPPYQFLNTPGGTAIIKTIEARDGTVTVNGNRRVVSLSAPSGFGAATYDQGDITADFLRGGRLPEAASVADPFGAASGALAYRLDLPAHGAREVDVLIPLHDGSAIPSLAGDMSPESWVEGRIESAQEMWREKLGRVVIHTTGFAGDLCLTLESQLAYILINRSGPAIQPGTRSYDRSWIRDGALTSSALLRMGHPEAVRDFIEWFASYQYENGKVPCCVDQRGADPVDEHDSAGEFIFLVAEYYRYTGDRSLLERMWPHVESAAAYLDSLRRLGRTDEYREPEKRIFFGLLPPSISHEGYSAKPMHSYWDDLFALRGFRDAATMAGVLGYEAKQKELAAIRDEFQADLIASIEGAMERHGIDYIPGCADLGDFDPTSTTIALDPVGADDILPRGALRRTFEKYYEFFVDRRERGDWEAFTPYEVRNIGAFVRLGWRDRAMELIEYFLSYKRPPRWNQWAEVVRKDERAPEFIGDMPHTWVGSDYIRSVLDMLVYVREDTESLVLGAGIPLAWVLNGDGVGVRNLPTPYGPIDFQTPPLGGPLTEKVIHLRIGGSLRMPPGGIEVRFPIEDAEVESVLVNDKVSAPGADGAIVVRELPAAIVIRLK